MGTHHTCVHVVKGYTKEEQGARGNSLWCIEFDTLQIFGFANNQIISFF
jgi:hypothetical protein